MRGLTRILVAVLATLSTCFALGANAAELQAGRDFRVISPPLMGERNKIEVTEFFWYGCPHCFDFEPVLADWVKKLPADVSFRRVPVIFPNNKWALGARLYYTLEAMNLLEKFHSDVFNAIHGERLRLDDEKVLFEWVARKGIDAKQFSETWSSFGVQSHMQQARGTVVAAGVTGVPAVMVQGRYLALTPGNYGELLANIDALVARVRAEAGKK
ncbi:MAG: thiol:disulfide interchange protein DsbA/DsbL [Rhodocyclales bacterium]|jgi:thiol:disulfide interchange protein DsbA|nr:thiol:disulfide interchange protein DsbA/DsbL [Rhodocyclales bacterium]